MIFPFLKRNPSHSLFFISFLFLLISYSAKAQQYDNTILSIERNKQDNTPTSITLAPSATWRQDQAEEAIVYYVSKDNGDVVWKLRYSTTTKSKVTTARYDEYYKGRKIEYGSYTATSKNGRITFLTGNYYAPAPATVSLPSVSEADAFSIALGKMGAGKYMWEDPLEEKRIQQLYHKPDTTFKPHGILTWIEDFSNGVPGDRKLHLAWAFDIYASKPLDREVIYVDAITGNILYSNPMIKHTAASGYSLYSRLVPIVTAHLGATYELFDSTRGSGVHTMNMHNGSSYGASTEYTSASDTWPVASPDSVAIDAHWGAEMVYDYWKVVQGRLSYDDADGILVQYVHYSSGYNNAFWDGMEMTYGDGTGCGSGFTPLASLDVTGHEIGHGVCQYTANLVYASESGAMNEGLSDCWGATIENWANPHEVDAVPKSTWKIGEEIKCGTPLRSMDFPHLQNDPDTYGGLHWINTSGCVPSGGNDECGVHTNSGVLNKWYYLVTNGGSGTNDIGSSYWVTGIGFTESANILYQTELVLSSTADYSLMRTTTINTATTLYGACSPEVVTVTNAWYAVGVGAAYVAYPAFITGPSKVCVGSTISLSDATPAGTWTSTYTGIATVDVAGNVFGVAPGIDTITYSIGAGCDAKAPITVNALPASTISPSPTALLCAGGSVVLTAGSGAGYTYQWKFAGSNIPGATNATYSATTAGNYTVITTNSNGCSAPSAITNVTIVALPGATITPSSSTVFCAGGSVVLNANAGIGYTYQWLLAGTPIPGATSISYAASIGGNYTVAVTNLSGCSSTSAITTVTVNPLPSAIMGPTSVCSGLTTTLNSTPAGGTWSSSDITVATVSGSGIVTGHGTGGIATITYTATTGCFISTTFTVNANVAAPISGPGAVCAAQTVSLGDATPGGTWTSSNPPVASIGSGTGIVTGASAGSAVISYVVSTLCGVATVTSPFVVNPVPAVAAVSGAGTLCTGGTAIFTDITPAGTWSSSNMAVATIGSGTGIATGVSAGATSISYSVTNGFGCTSIAASTLNVFAPFTATATPAGPTSFCTGDAVVINASTGPGYLYQWNNGGVAISGATNSSYTASATGSYSVWIHVASGCGSASGAVAVNVNPLPLVAPSVTVTASPAFEMCITPAPITFTAVPAYGGPSPSYQWLVNGLPVGGSSTYGYTPAAGDVVTCQMISNYVCASPLTASHSYTVTLIPSTLVPSVSITASPVPMCSGDTITFAANPVYGGTAPTYLWTRNGVNVATGPHYHYVPSAGDDLVVTMTTNQSCVSSSIVSSATFSVPVQNRVTNSIAISVSQSSIVAGAVDTFIAVATNGGASPAFRWLRNGVVIPGATTFRYITSSLSNGDVISCMETTSADCAAPATVVSSGIRVVVNPNGVQLLNNNDNALRLLPNPNKGEFTISGSIGSADADVTITVTDVLGQIIYRKPVSTVAGMLNETISLSAALANGMYFVTIQSTQTSPVFHMVLNR